MRYISLVIIVVAMYLSWRVVETPAAVPEATHVLIQEDLKRIISEKIQEDLPSAQEVQFDRFWTQNLKAGKVKAQFLVSFDLPDESDPTRHGIQGQYVLTFDPKSGQWSGDGDFEYTQITFKNGVLIRPSGAEGAEEMPAEAPSVSTPKAVIPAKPAAPKAAAPTPAENTAHE